MIHGGDAAVVVLAFCSGFGIHGAVFWASDDGLVRGVEPDGGEELIVLV